ncbi:MAG: alpha/beta fold hydrolase, partial [Methylocella sp.]
MFEMLDRGVRLAFIDERPAPGDRGEPILLIHGFASTHAVNWVFPQWVRTLTEAGRRVVAFDNRGHGRSEKFYDPAAYALPEMAEDARVLLDHLR